MTLKFSQFESILKSRRDGFWGLLATAAGDDESVKATAASLTSRKLEEGPGTAGTPTLVENRIEALSVSHPEMIPQLAREWRRPRQLAKREVFDGTADLLIAAWRCALRHLVAVGAAWVRELESDILAIEEERGVYHGPVPLANLTWREILSEIGRGRVTYFTRRALDRVSPELSAVGVMELGQLLAPQEGLSHPAWERLRILRRRQQCLLPEARTWLCEQLASADFPPLPFAAGLAVAVETSIGLSEALGPLFLDKVARGLSQGERPIDLAPLIYVLLKRGWTTP